MKAMVYSSPSRLELMERPAYYDGYRCEKLPGNALSTVSLRRGGAQPRWIKSQCS
jgi:hypothetical protein